MSEQGWTLHLHRMTAERARTLLAAQGFRGAVLGSNARWCSVTATLAGPDDWKRGIRQEANGRVVEMLGQEGLDGELTDDELVRRMLKNLGGLPFVDGTRFDAATVFAQGGGHRWEFRRNTAHHMRYLLCEPGHWKYRLGARISGYDNLLFAGDWVRSSQPTPSTEAAVRAGVAAAETLVAEGS